MELLFKFSFYDCVIVLRPIVLDRWGGGVDWTGWESLRKAVWWTLGEGLCRGLRKAWTETEGPVDRKTLIKNGKSAWNDKQPLWVAAVKSERPLEFSKGLGALLIPFDL